MIGAISHPDQASSFFGGLRRAEFPSTMYPHPTPPINLSKYTLKTWEKKFSCEASEVLEPPYDEEGQLTLRAFLRIFERRSKLYREDKSEIDTFMLKFTQMLFDGVTVERTWAINGNNENNRTDSAPSKALMKLWHLPEDSWEDAQLHFTSRVRSSKTATKTSPDFQFPFQNVEVEAESFRLNCIVSISKKMPGTLLLSSKQKLSEEQAKKRQKRFVCFEMRDGTKVFFYARTGKDASLLSCGLKLLIERVQINL